MPLREAARLITCRHWILHVRDGHWRGRVFYRLSTQQYTVIVKGVFPCRSTTHTMPKENHKDSSLRKDSYRTVRLTSIIEISLVQYVGHTIKKTSCMDYWHDILVSRGTCCVLVISEIMLQHIMACIPHPNLHTFFQRVELYSFRSHNLILLVSFLRECKCSNLTCIF